ncbi:MAG: hypothetical protein WC139_12895 [Candidatus Kapaibacterium sp.]
MAAITLVQNLKVGNSNIVSVHNFNKLTWTFVPTDDTKAITSQVVIGAYTFNGVQTALNTGTTPDTYSYELDVTEILKYFATDFYYKNVAAGINTSTLLTALDIDINGLEDGSETDSETLSLYLSHGRHQIGNVNGSNMKEIYDKEKMIFHQFNGFPFELYMFFTHADARYGYIGAVKYFDNLANAVGLNSLKITAPIVQGSNTLRLTGVDPWPAIYGWDNDAALDPYDTFGNTGSKIDAAISTSTKTCQAWLTNAAGADGWKWKLSIGMTYRIKYNLGMYGGELPILAVTNGKTTGFAIHVMAVGLGAIEFTYTGGITSDIAGISVFNSLATSFDLGISFEEVPIDTTIKNFNSICDGKMIKYLSSEGFYRYWLFNKYFKITGNQTKIGSLVSYFDTMVGAQSRSKNIGFKDAFQKLLVTSEMVAKEDQKILLDIFTSPAVYLLDSGRAPFIDDFTDTITGFNSRWTSLYGTGETTIVNNELIIGNNSGNDERIYEGKSIKFDPNRLYRIRAKIKKTAGTGTIYIGVTGRDATDSVYVGVGGGVTIQYGYFAASLGNIPTTSWVEYTGYLKGHSYLADGAAAPTSTSPGSVFPGVEFIRPYLQVNYHNTFGITYVEYFEIAYADDDDKWVLVDVEGEHTINEKNNFQSLSATLVLPELYTQKL